jgi:phosphate-selective porin OprO/OprP
MTPPATRPKPRIGRLGAATTLASLALTGLSLATSAHAQQAPSPDAASPARLQAEVEALKALVQSQASRDQAQIQALSDQVRALKAQLDQETPVRTATGAPAPRASQNATGQFNLSGAASDAHAEDAVAQPRIVQNSSHRFMMQSADGGYSIGFTGDIQFDAGAYNFHADSPLAGPQGLSNGVNARRARIGVTGTAPGGWGFALVYDAGNSSDQTAKGIETAQLVYGGLKGVALEVGYSNTYFTLDQATGSNDTLFLERATPSNIATNFNAGDARANAGIRLFGDRYWLGGYLTGPASGDSHTLVGERFGAFERAAVQALKGPDYSLHLGVGVDELIQAPNTGSGTASTLSLSDQPELRIDPTTLLNTGTIGTVANPVTRAYVFNLETAATFRNLFWQGEYYHYQVQRQGLANADFDGGYGQVSWTLTGESHAYNPQAASYFRISPKTPFSLAHGGWGAWEVAARVDYVNLNSQFTPGLALSAEPAAIDGGLQRGLTLGLNWYPNDLVRLLLDYNHVDYDKANGAVVRGLALGAPVGARFDALSLRFQVAY